MLMEWTDIGGKGTPLGLTEGKACITMALCEGIEALTLACLHHEEDLYDRKMEGMQHVLDEISILLGLCGGSDELTGAST